MSFLQLMHTIDQLGDAMLPPPQEDPIEVEDYLDPTPRRGPSKQPSPKVTTPVATPKSPDAKRISFEDTMEEVISFSYLILP